MGACISTKNAVYVGANEKKARRLPKEYIQAMDKYLPDFKHYETSTDAHRQTCANHWNEVFRETGSSKSNNSSSRRSTFDSQVVSRITALYDTFYTYLDEHSPELKPVFRSSMHVRSKVLVHISAGMRSILLSENFTQRATDLTRTHMRYGVQVEFFNPLGNALLFAMKECSDGIWSPEIDEAWRRLFAHCAVMLLVHHLQEMERQQFRIASMGGPTIGQVDTSPAIGIKRIGHRSSIREEIHES